MPLVEVVPGADTSQQILDATMTFLKSEGKKPIKIKDCPGFLVSRILGAYMNEAMWLLQEEVGILDMEAIVSDLGMPMGPITLGEMVGWDIIRASNETLRNYYGSRFEIPPLLKRLNNDKRLGIKTGRGLMDHSTRPPAATEDLVPSSRTPDDGTRVRAGRQLMGAIWAESIRCMEEGVAGAREIDAAMIMGAGFPRGPLAWADETGLDEVANLLSSLTATLGERFLPAPVLRIFAMAGYLGTKAGRGLAGSYRAPSGGEGKRGAEGA
jgi:3-hydroxyacyl-CoA dehydrogenase